MTSCCLSTADSFFDKKRVSKELRRYHKKGPQGITRILINALKIHDLKDLTLLEIGGGIGVICHELLRSGIQTAVIVEMSSASIAIAKKEAEQTGNSHLSFIHGDLVEQESSVPQCDVVVLDKVVCCYPEMKQLVEKASSKSDKIIALSYPRERWYTRLIFALDNWKRKQTGNPFRSFIHEEKTLHKILEHGGFKSLFNKQTLIWNIEIYARSTVPEPFRKIKTTKRTT